MMNKWAMHRDFSSHDGKQIVAVLLSIGLILWFLTIATTHITSFEPDSLHYAKQLPGYYWAGIGLVCCALCMRFLYGNVPRNTSWLVDLYLAAVAILYVFGTNTFVYNNPRPNDSYLYSDLAQSVLTVGHAEVGEWGSAGTVYLDGFPGVTVFVSMLAEVFSVDVLSLEKYASLLVICLLSFIIYVLAAQVSPRYAVFAPIGYVSLSFVSGFHLVPQHVALVLTSTFLLILISLLRRRELIETNGVVLTILVVAIWIAIVVSHPTTPLIDLVAFAAIILMSAVFLVPGVPFLTRNTILPAIKRAMITYGIFSWLFLGIYLGYLLFRADFILADFSALWDDIVDDLREGQLIAVSDQSVETPLPSYLTYYRARWFEIIGILVFGISSGMVLVYRRRFLEPVFLFGTLMIGYCALAMALVVFGESAADYGPDRALIFGLVPCCVLFSMVFAARLKKWGAVFSFVVLLFIIVSIIAVPVTRFGNDPYNFMSDSELAGKVFAANHEETGLDTVGFGNALMAESPFINTWYCFFELKQQRGSQYWQSLEGSQHKLYDSGQCGLYIIE